MGHLGVPSVGGGATVSAVAAILKVSPHLWVLRHQVIPVSLPLRVLQHQVIRGNRWSHSGLRFNLNLCLFLQTFNAISESEYVKIGSMCIFFLISMICLRENALLYIFRVKFKSCSISIRQRLLFTNFVTIFCTRFIQCLHGSVAKH